MLTRAMLEQRRDALRASLLQLQGAFDCITELLEADAVVTPAEFIGGSVEKEEENELA